MAVALAVIGALLVSLGLGVISLPAGIVVAGAQCIAAAYVVAYLKARAAK